jgi:predicted acylesterase/phospholipase RssA
MRYWTRFYGRLWRRIRPDVLVGFAIGALVAALVWVIDY